MQSNKHPLRGLLAAQVIEAFSDNAWKLIIFTLATRAITKGPELNQKAQSMATLSLVAFLLPMLVFSFPAGAVADRFSKRSIIIAMKVVGVVLMSFAALSLWALPGNLLIPFIILGFMGVQGAIFSPAKYGILPEILPKEKLSKGNSLIEMGTMLAIIGGTGLGPVLLTLDNGGAKPHLTFTAPLILTFIALLAFFCSFSVPKVPPAKQAALPAVQTMQQAWQAMRKDRILWLAILGSLVYWLSISLIGQNVLVFAKALVLELEKGEFWQGIPPAAYGIGIAAGALLAGRLSGSRIEYGLIPLGTIGFASTAFLLGVAPPSMLGSILILLFMGVSTGLLVVPLHAIIQWRAPADKRGAIIAACNIFDIAGMLAGSFLSMLMTIAGFDLDSILMLSSLVVLAAAAWGMHVLPHGLAQLIFRCYAKLFYKIEVTGRENLASKGPTFVLSEHFSSAKALLLALSVERRVRLILPESLYDDQQIKPIAKMMGAIPVSKKMSPEDFLRHYKKTSGCPEEQIFFCVVPGKNDSEGTLQTFVEGINVLASLPSSEVLFIDFKETSFPFSVLLKSFFKKEKKLMCSAVLSFGKLLTLPLTTSFIQDALKKQNDLSGQACAE